MLSAETIMAQLPGETRTIANYDELGTARKRRLMNPVKQAAGGPSMGLFTDLYELTMAQAYFEYGMSGTATFGLFVRQLPPNRGFLVAAGLKDVLDYLEGLRFEADDLDFLESTGIFSADFLRSLEGFQFNGSVRAMPEGTVFFEEEPLLEITAPIVEAQIAETFAINQVNLQSLLATKAARCVEAAEGRAVSDFGARRTHGTDAALKMAKCGYIAGFQATSNMLASKRYGITPVGTMAHSFILSFQRESEAFSAYALSFPDRAVLLLDTYDTIGGADKAVIVAKELEATGHRLAGVRLDSGNLGELSGLVRRILDDADLGYVPIVASGGLDEYSIQRLVRDDAPIDMFGVGTRVGVSEDAAWSDMAYKLVEYGGQPTMKLSEGKVSPPGSKQVFRSTDAGGMFADDVVGKAGEEFEGGFPLLHPVMDGGHRLNADPSLDEIRETLSEGLARLGERYKDISAPERYPVAFSPGLSDLTEQIRVNILESNNLMGPDPR